MSHYALSITYHFGRLFFFMQKWRNFLIDKENRMLVFQHPVVLRILIILPFSGRLRLFLTSYARLLVMLSFTNFLLNARFRTVSFESA